MVAPSNFIPLPLTHPLPVIGANEATINYDPQHVPIVATRFVDVSASPSHIHLPEPLRDPVDIPLLVNLCTEAKCLPSRVLQGIFSAGFFDAHKERDVGDRAVVYAIPSSKAHPKPPEDISPTYKLMHRGGLCPGSC